MKNIFKSIYTWFNNLSNKIARILPKIWQAIFLIGIVTAIVLGINAGILMIGLLTTVVIIFVWLRQLWWFITKTGDYEKNNKKG